MIKQQFEQLKAIRKGFVYKDFEVIDNKIVKKFYFRNTTNKNPNAVVEECHEFYLEDDRIVEKITRKESDLAIFSKNNFVLPEGCSFSAPIEAKFKYHDNVVVLAFQFGIEFKDSHGKLFPFKWSTLAEIINQLEFILLQGSGHRMPIRRADTAYFSFQDEHYLVTHSSIDYVLHRSSIADTSGKAISNHKSVMDLILAVGIQKFQFGITDNGG